MRIKPNTNLQTLIQLTESITSSSISRDLPRLDSPTLWPKSKEWSSFYSDTVARAKELGLDNCSASVIRPAMWRLSARTLEERRTKTRSIEWRRANLHANGASQSSNSPYSFEVLDKNDKATEWNSNVIEYMTMGLRPKLSINWAEPSSARAFPKIFVTVHKPKELKPQVIKPKRSTDTGLSAKLDRIEYKLDQLLAEIRIQNEDE